MINIITRHIDPTNLKSPAHAVDAICAFTGNAITKGVLVSDIVKKTFTDYESMKFKSKYVSLDIALLLERTIQGEKGLNSMRNYSFYADENRLILLKREQIHEFLHNIPGSPFCVCITYSNKKHIAYKAVFNHNTDSYKIVTDTGIVNFDKQKAIEIAEIAQCWYTVLPGKQLTEQKPTYFTKGEISGLATPQHKKIQQYGTAQYFAEEAQLKKLRGTALFKLILHVINKKI